MGEIRTVGQPIIEIKSTNIGYPYIYIPRVEQTSMQRENFFYCKKNYKTGGKEKFWTLRINDGKYDTYSAKGILGHRRGKHEIICFSADISSLCRNPYNYNCSSSRL